VATIHERRQREREREGEAEFEVAVESAPAKDWARWLAELARHPQEQLPQFGGPVVAGFVAAIVILYAFTKLAYEVLEQETATLDTRALEFVQQFRSPELTRAAEIIALFGSELVWVIGLILLGVFAWQRRWGAAVALALVAGGAQVLNDILKELFHRTRPESLHAFIPAQEFSFPSGHAMVAAAFYFCLAYLAWRVVHAWWRNLVIVGLLVLVLLIGLARIYLEAHYLSDVIAGYLAGFLWADAVILGSRALKMRAHRRLPPHTLTG
jgi:membrane-associated phospholipid phosphatase